MDIVCASPCAHQFGSVQVRRRSFWGGSGDGSAVYLERLLDIVFYGSGRIPVSWGVLVLIPCFLLKVFLRRQ